MNTQPLSYQQVKTTIQEADYSLNKFLQDYLGDRSLGWEVSR